MNKELKPYPEYKKPGFPWLKQIPAHWDIRRGKNVFNPIDIRSQTGEEELLTVSSKFGVVPRKNTIVTMFKAESYVGYKLCWPDDLVINSLWAWATGLGVSKYHGIVSTAYGIYRLKNRSENNPNYIDYLLRSVPYQWEFQVRSKGVWTSRLQLTDESFLDAPIPLPPLEEQNAIVRYLNYMDVLIKRYIHAKQKEIKLLNEQKQVIIQQAVTRGLDPSVKLKPSGIEWLGDIPEHWKLLPGKACFREKKNINKGNLTSQVLSLSYGKIVVRPVEKLHGLVPASFDTYQVINPNDIIVRSTDMQNDHTSLRFGLSQIGGIITAAYICLNAFGALTSEYGYLLLHTYDLNKIIYRLGSGLRQNLSWEDFKYLPCLLPPQKEQISISNYVENHNIEINSQIDKIQNSIQLLQQFANRLFSDVVTGQIDVHEIAQSLPVEIGTIENEEEVIDIEEALEEIIVEEE